MNSLFTPALALLQASLTDNMRQGILHLRGHRPGEAEGAFLDLLRTADREAEARALRLLGELGLPALAA